MAKSRFIYAAIREYERRTLPRCTGLKGVCGPETLTRGARVVVVRCVRRRRRRWRGKVWRHREGMGLLHQSAQAFHSFKGCPTVATIATAAAPVYPAAAPVYPQDALLP